MFQTAQIHCPICDSLDHRLVYDFTHANLEDAVPGFVIICVSCGMLFKHFEINLHEVYSTKYAQRSLQEGYMGGNRASRFFQEVLNKSKFYNKSSSNKPRLLDIGTGLGTMLEVAEKLGFEAEGVELCPELAYIAKSKGLKVRTVSVEELHLGNNKFEVITMLDVIEHLPKPLAVLQSLRRLLVSEGELIIYTPNHRAPIVKAAKFFNILGFKRPIENIFATNHVSFFNDKTLSEILKKANFQERKKIIKPYDFLRPGGPITFINLLMISAIEYLGYSLTGLGFRLLVYADMLP